MKILSVIIIFGICILSISCNFSTIESKSSANLITVPKLLDRNEKLFYGKEWENTQNEYVEARENLKLENINPENYLRLASIFSNEARITGEHGHYYPAALMVLDKALESNPNEDILFRAMTMKASVLLSQHEFQQALDLGKAALKLNPYNAHIYGVLVDAYVELGDYNMAVSMTDKMINIRPDLRSYARVSYLREIHGDIKGSKEAMQLAVDAGYPPHEQTAWTRLTLGELHHTYGNLEAAKLEYKKILNTRKDYPFAIAALANINIQEGDLENAETLLEEAIEIIPEVGFYEQLAHLYKSTNRKNEFDTIVSEIFLMLEDDVIHGHNMNMEYASFYLDLLEKPNKALDYALLEYSKRPENIDINRLLAKIYFAKSDLKNAEKHSKAAAKTGSLHPDLIDIKAALLAIK